MSWSFTFEADTDPAKFSRDAGTAYAAATIPTDQIANGRDSIENAIAAALLIVASGAVGTSHRVRCSLSGHANPGHEPTAGWANDMVTITISQLTT